MKIRVYYEDTDVGGVVYHANYLKFCERARSESFFERGLSPIMERGHFVIRHIDALYLASAKLGDMVHISTQLIEFKKASFKLHQEVFRKDVKLFEMDITIVYLDFEGNIQIFDDASRELLGSLFNQVQDI